jgi:hypothetical protein
MMREAKLQLPIVSTASATGYAADQQGGASQGQPLTQGDIRCTYVVKNMGPCRQIGEA